MTVETVYAIHTFEAESLDEIPFQLGEPIIVLEKDEIYKDGWWKGENVQGQVGLFPMNYTSYERPIPISPLRVKTPPSTPAAPDTPTSTVNMHGSDLDLPLPPFRMPSPSIDETIDDIQDKLQKMAVRTDEEQIYQNRLIQQQQQQQQYPYSPKNGHSSKLFMPSSSGSSSTTSSRMSSAGKHHSSPHSQFELIGSTRKVETSIANGRQVNGHPATWGVEQVCMWLSKRGFESEMHHFIENDITGDVLLSLSVSTLLKELNITSFGKRVHIMNAISELRTQFAFNNENDDISDLEDYQHVQATSLYSDSVINLQNNVYSNQVPDSSVSLQQQYQQYSNISLPQINDLAFPRQLDSPRVSTTNLVKNSPPTYYTHSQRVDDAEGANIETVLPKSSSNKKDKIFAKLRRSANNLKKDQRSNTTGWDIDKTRSSVAGNLPKRSLDLEKLHQSLSYRNTNYFFENIVDNGDINDEIMRSIGEPDYKGWLKKQGDRYKTWKSRYCILKGTNLYYFKNEKDTEPSDVKGYINLAGYRIIPDENISHGKYGFKLIHDIERSHYFAHEELEKMKGWMKAMMKATISRDGKAPVISSSNIVTVPLSEARKLTPRPPDARRPSVSTAAINKISSPILRPMSPLSQRAGSPIPMRPTSPTTTIQNSSSPFINPYSNNRTTEFF